MALLERVATLIRANLNDMVDRAEDPEKMIKQVILDMQNQLLQVKTQVAISIADKHVLEKKQAENEESERQWMKRAEMALDKKDDPLARAGQSNGGEEFDDRRGKLGRIRPHEGQSAAHRGRGAGHRRDGR